MLTIRRPRKHRNITQRVIRNARSKGVTIVGRRGWRNISLVYAIRRKTRRHALLPEHPADTLWQHITVTPVEPIRPAMRRLHDIGMDRFGSGVSYNFAVHPVTGEVGLGQALDAKGTHTLNLKRIQGYSFDQNAVSLAVVVIGMPGVQMTDKAIHAQSLLIAAMIEEKALTFGHDYNPHRMVAAKDCPTDNIVAVMGRIQRNAKREARKK